MNLFRNQHPITDKGWQQMSRRLDQEMPHKERSGRTLLVWWLPLLLGIFSSVGLVMFFMDKKIEIRIEDRHPKKVVQIQQNSDDQFVNSHIQADNFVSLQATPSLVPSLEQYNRPSKTFVEKGSGIAQELALRYADFSPLYLTFNTSGTRQQSDAAPQSLQDQYYDLKYGIACRQASGAFVTSKILPSSHPFEALESAKERIKPAFTAESTPVQIHKRKDLPLQLGLSLLAGTDRFDGLNSAQAGLALDWKPFEHWGIRSGLYYEQFIPSPLARPVAEVDPVQYAIATKNYDFLRFNGGSVPDVAIPVLKLHRLRTPLLLTYAPNKLARFFAGVSFGYTLYAQAAKRGLVNSNSLVTFRASAENSVSELVTKELPRFNTQGHFGVAFRLNNIELGLFYQQQMGFIEQKSNTLFDANGQYNPRRRFFEDSKPNRLLTFGTTLFF